MQLSYAPAAEPDAPPAGPEAGWQAWAAAHEPPAVLATAWSGRAVFGFDSPLRVGGVLVQPADVVLGIRGWEDAFEDTLALAGHDRPVPYALFDIEKIVRMMLHQSGLAFEVLASPVVLAGDEFKARRVLEAAITHEILHHYRDVAAGTLARLDEAEGEGAWAADVLDIARHALTGVALAQGRVDFRLWPLVADFGDAGLEGLLREVERSDTIDPTGLAEFGRHVDDLVERIDPDAARLPDRPRDYDWLDEFVVANRLGTAVSC